MYRERTAQDRHNLLLNIDTAEQLIVAELSSHTLSQQTRHFPYLLITSQGDRRRRLCLQSRSICKADRKSAGIAHGAADRGEESSERSGTE